MSNAFVEFLAARAPRERWLIGLLLLVVGPLAVVFGLLLPLRDAHQDAVRAQDDAVALQNWVVERVAEKRGLDRAQGPITQTPAPIGSSGLEQSLINADLRAYVSELGVRDAGVIALRFDTVTFQTLANWVSAAQPVWGYAISSFNIEASDEPGKVRASFTLTPQEPD